MSPDRMNVTCWISLRPSNHALSFAQGPGSWDPGQSAFPVAATGRANARFCASASREADGRRCCPMATAATQSGRSPRNPAKRPVRQSGIRPRGALVRLRAVAEEARRASRCAWTSTGKWQASRPALSLRDLRPGVRAACPRAPRRRPKNGAVGTPGIGVRWWCRRASAATRTSARDAALRAAAPPPATPRRMRTAPESVFHARRGTPLQDAAAVACAPLEESVVQHFLKKAVRALRQHYPNNDLALHQRGCFIRFRP